MPDDPPPPARCQWVWGVNQWHLEDNPCGLGTDCSPPAANGTVVGEVAVTDCTAS